MISAILIALCGGAFVAAGRSMNARLGEAKGVFQSSFWNHFGGAVFILLLIPLFGSIEFSALAKVPFWTLTGGVIGAGFVAISSFVFPRLGATRSALLIIGGQMGAGLVIDMMLAGTKLAPMHFLGLALIVAGIVVARLRG